MVLCFRCTAEWVSYTYINSLRFFSHIDHYRGLSSLSHTVRGCVFSHFSQVRLFVALWTVAPWVPLSMGFYRQREWSGWPYFPPTDLPDQGLEPVSLTSPSLTGEFFTTVEGTWETEVFKVKVPMLGLLSYLMSKPWHHTLVSLALSSLASCSGFALDHLLLLYIYLSLWGSNPALLMISLELEVPLPLKHLSFDCYGLF